MMNAHTTHRPQQFCRRTPRTRTAVWLGIFFYVMFAVAGMWATLELTMRWWQ